MSARSLALVIPVYQYDKYLSATLRKLKTWKSRHAHEKIWILFSDDGSTDRTPALLEAWVKEQGDDWHLVRGEVNQGKGAAVRRGISEAQKLNPTYIVFSDCDLYYGLEVVYARMVPALETYDIAVVDRSWKRAELSISAARRLASALFNRAVSILTGVTFRDTQGGLKGFRARECRPLFEVLRLNGFAFDVEVLSVANHFRYKVGQIPVTFPGPIRAFPSTVSVVTASIKMVRDLFRINVNWHSGAYHSQALISRVEQTVYLIPDSPSDEVRPDYGI